MQGVRAWLLLVSVWTAHKPDSAALPHEKLTENRSQIAQTEKAVKLIDSSSIVGLTKSESSSSLPGDSSNSTDPAVNLIVGLTESYETTDSLKIPSNDTSSADSHSSALEESDSNPAKVNPKREIEKETFKGINPLLLFPTLPFLFPKKIEAKSDLGKNDLSPEREGEESKEESKPFIFFKVAFNIRQIPIKNGSDQSSNDSKIINVKKIGSDPGEDLKRNLKSERRRRNAKSDREMDRFLDDFSLFPDSEMDDEFFPKPDFFFPDLLFRKNPTRKLSRRKRDMKKPDFKNDFNFFMDMFDETFMKAKRDLEETNPFLAFLKGEERQGDLFGEESSLARNPDKRNPNSNWKIERNVKGIESDRPQSELIKTKENPLIIVDNVMKIGEVHMHDSAKSKKKKKREMNEPKKKHRESIHDGNEYQESKSKILRNELDILKPEKTLETTIKKKKNLDSSDLNGLKIGHVKVQESESEILNASASVAGNGGNFTGNRGKNEKSIDSTSGSNSNSTGNDLDYAGDLIRVMNSLEAEIEGKLTERIAQERDRIKSKPEGKDQKHNPRKPIYGDLERNITRVLTQFLLLFKKLNDAKIELNEADSFDWTEKETLQNSNAFEKRSKKSSDFVQEYVEKKKKDRQVADLNYLFLTVTLPTVIISALLLLICFFNLQVKGKICTKLFKPRHVFVVEDENPPHFAVEKAKKVREI